MATEGFIVQHLKKKKLAPELIQLAELIGQFIQYWGFKSIHGKIWTILYLSEDRHSSVELSRKLAVSKTLISFAIADLLEYKVIEEAGRGEKNTHYFRANPDISSVILNVLKIRELKMMSNIHDHYLLLKKSVDKKESKVGLNTERLDELGRFIFSGEEALNAFIQYSSTDVGLIEEWLRLISLFSRKKSKI